MRESRKGNKRGKIKTKEDRRGNERVDETRKEGNERGKD